MASNPSNPLTASDLTDFIAAESAFALEMAALQALRTLGFDAEHAAAYVDPVTTKIRAYDIRARLVNAARSFRLAVECKNLQRTSPLLVHATPRLPTEAYHTVVKHYRIGDHPFSRADKLRSKVYEAGVSVGRQTDQPTKDDKGKFKSSDGPTYEKWLQAVNGCLDLVQELAAASHSETHFGVIVPFLVVPVNTLWQVDYDDDGTVVTQVRQVERATLILRHSWTAQISFSPLKYDISHLEIVALPALSQRVKDLTEAGGLLSDLR